MFCRGVLELVCDVWVFVCVGGVCVVLSGECCDHVLYRGVLGLVCGGVWVCIVGVCTPADYYVTWCL